MGENDVEMLFRRRPPECCIVCKYANLFVAHQMHVHKADEIEDGDRLTGVYCGLGVFIPVAKQSCKRQKKEADDGA